MKQLATIVPDDIHAEFKALATSRGSTVYEMLATYVHNELGKVYFNGLGPEEKIQALLLVLGDIPMGKSIRIEQVKKILSFKTTDDNVRRALRREFKPLEDGSWTRIVGHK